MLIAIYGAYAASSPLAHDLFWVGVGEGGIFELIIK